MQRLEGPTWVSQSPATDLSYRARGLTQSTVSFRPVALEPYPLRCPGWNCLDFAVVCAGILELTSFGNYTFIRCFRVLRPLRAITKIEALKVGGAAGGLATASQRPASNTIHMYITLWWGHTQSWIAGASRGGAGP